MNNYLVIIHLKSQRCSESRAISYITRTFASFLRAFQGKIKFKYFSSQMSIFKDFSRPYEPLIQGSYPIRESNSLTIP